ncbi:680_t:CDS:2, partial [Racocetra fulgida]
KLYKQTGHIEEIEKLYEDIKRYGIDPQSPNINPEEQYAIKKRQRKIWKSRNLIREAALRRLYSKLQTSESLEPYQIWKKKYIQENYEDLQRYKKSG